ncbi:MAG: DUF4157 domain-containing protein [Dehalococcoidia bacterium]
MPTRFAPVRARAGDGPVPPTRAGRGARHAPVVDRRDAPATNHGALSAAHVGDPVIQRSVANHVLADERTATGADERGDRLPRALAAGVRRLSGLDVGDVRVHRDSAEPARIDALAFTQGAHVYLALGQERQLAHEAWHVVQQRQGRVRATTAIGSRAVNDDAVLEREADAAGHALAGGDRAAGFGARATHAATQSTGARAGPIQRQGHTDRNVLNLVVVGRLTPVDGASPTFQYDEGGHNTYVDEAGVEWVLLPDWMSEFHQPDGHEQSDHPYPNKKFLHPDSSGGSSEAIMRPDGTFITTGPLRGTYNYSNPEGVFGNIGHFFQDILPHVFNDQYEDVDQRDPRSTLDPDTFAQRYQQQVGPIGPATTTNVTDPVDRQVTRQTGVVWLDSPSGEVLALTSVENGRLTFLRFIDSDLRDDALAAARRYQPRGVQTVGWGPPAIFGVPSTVPATAARR